MAKEKSGPAEESNDASKSQTDGDNTLAASDDHPINLLLELATDDNVETDEGHEVKVDNVREAGGNSLLTKSELQKYDDYKRQWAASLARPQESLDNLTRREQQIIEAAANHDWEALDRLRQEVDDDLEKMKFIYSSIASDMTNL